MLWALRFKRRSLSTKAREALYDRCRGAAEVPTCNICGRPILIGEAWDESHEGAPHALGGTQTGVAHRACNRRDNAETVTPMVAKAKRVRRRFIGAHAPRHPLPCGCRSTTSKGIDGQVRGRLSGAEKHARALRARRIGFISLTEA